MARCQSTLERAWWLSVDRLHIFLTSLSPVVTNPSSVITTARNEADRADSVPTFADSKRGPLKLGFIKSADFTGILFGCGDLQPS
jgi:hypothetical protein